MKFRMLKGRRGDEVPFEEYTLVMLNGIALSKTPNGAGKNETCKIRTSLLPCLGKDTMWETPLSLVSI